MTTSSAPIDNERRLDRKFSVLLVCRSYPPIIGGSEIEAQRVCAGLIRRGHRMEVLCCGGDPMPKERRWIDAFGVPVRMYGNGAGRRNDYVYALGVAWTLLRERKEFDLVYFLMAGLQVAVGVPLCRLLQLPSVMKFAGSNDLQDTMRAMIGPLEVAAIRKWCAATMVLNDGMVQEALAEGFTRGQLVWMPNPVDTEAYRPCAPGQKEEIRSRLGLPLDSPLAVFVGRLAPEKELPSLIDGFAIAARQNDAVKLVLVGGGVIRPELERQVQQLGLSDRVIFAGMQNPDSIREWLQAADIFLLVSRREGLPVSLIEAMSAGLPSVVTDLPANTQLVQSGVHGLHVKVQDSGGIASALVRLLSDADLRSRFGTAARAAVVDAFSVDKVLDRYEALFSRLLDGAEKTIANYNE